MREIDSDNPLAGDVVAAIRNGDVAKLTELLCRHNGLATAQIVETQKNCPGGRVSRSLLHIATDWPGHFPNGPAVVRALIEQGADVNVRVRGPHSETPLHWAASTDDVAVLDALLDAGADLEAGGAVIAGGSALADAVAFGQWKAARRLIERGARSNLWESAALGLIDRLQEFFRQPTLPSRDEITRAFWCACHGGQRGTAEYLLSHGADMNWVGWDKRTALDAASRSGATEVVEWLRSAGAKPAQEV